jgi:methyl-accepting chemotaxis protein
MNIFNNLKVGTKIFTGFFIILFLMVMIGGMAIFKITFINATVINLADNIAYNQRLADKMVAHILLARFYANKYIRDHHSDDLNRFYDEFTQVEGLLAEAHQKITKEDRVKMLANLKVGIQTYRQFFRDVIQIMDKRHQILSEILDVQGPLAEEKLTQLRESAFQANDATASFYAANAQQGLLLMRLDAFKYLQEGKVQWFKKFEESYQETQLVFQKLDEELQDASRRQLAQEAQIAINQYHQSFLSLQSDYVRQNEIVTTQLDIIGPQIRKTASDMANSVTVDFEEVHLATQTLVTQTWIQLFILMLIAIFLGLSLSFAISRSITIPLATVIKINNQMVAGNLSHLKEEQSHQEMSQILQRKDEMGNIGRTFDNLANYFKALIEDIVTISQGLAEGNLRVRPKTEYRGDFGQIKIALETAISSLLLVIEDIVQVSQSLAEGKQTATAQAEYKGDFLKIKQALETASTKQAEMTTKNATQDWLKTGQMQLNQKITGEQEMMTLAKNVITFLTTYLNAQVGAFYMLEERKKMKEEKAKEELGDFDENIWLKLIASYAYTQRKGSPNEFQLGEGLVGQAALEQQSILVTDIPEDYIAIQSGLGETIPQNILVIPFLYENTVKGIIEIASLHTFTDIQLEFLEQIMPSIGIAVNTTTSRMQMQQILQQV